MSSTNQEHRPDFAVPPGEVLLEYLEAVGMSQAEFAERMGLSRKTVNEIIKAKAPITSETAIRLERVLGRPAHFWTNLEANYQATKSKLEEEAQLRADTEWLDGLPLREMAKLGWIRWHENRVQQLQEVLAYFGIASIRQWDSVWEGYDAAFRQSRKSRSTSEAISAWLRRGELVAQQVECRSYNATNFRAALDSIRALTRESVAVFQSDLVTTCAECGVAVAFVPELPKTGISGATRWLSKDKALIQLSLRYKTNDHLWFTFFHEAGHILLHRKRAVFLEGVGIHNGHEDEADRFAGDVLIPPPALQGFLREWDKRSLEPIAEFADQIGVAPGIVVGRLQHDRLLPYTHGNRLKVRLSWRTSV